MINLVPKFKKNFSISRMNETTEKLINYSEISEFKTDRSSSITNKFLTVVPNREKPRKHSYIQMTCPQCHFYYNANHRKPLVLTQCKHSICEPCSKESTIIECPCCFTRHDQSKLFLPYNWTLMSIIENASEKENINPQKINKKCSKVKKCEKCKKLSTHICSKHGCILCANCTYKHITECKIQFIKEIDEIDNAKLKVTSQLNEFIADINAKHNQISNDKAKLLKELDGKINSITQIISKSQKNALCYYQLNKFLLTEHKLKTRAIMSSIQQSETKKDANSTGALREKVSLINQLEHCNESASELHINAPINKMVLNEVPSVDKLISDLWSEQE